MRESASEASKNCASKELRMLKSYLAFTSAVHHVLTRAYERLGAAIARKPLLTILLSVAAISLANLGLLKLRSVGDAIALWVPGASSYHEQRRAIDAAFGSFDQALALLLPRAPHRALSADVLLEAADLHEAVLAWFGPPPSADAHAHAAESVLGHGAPERKDLLGGDDDE